MGRVAESRLHRDFGGQGSKATSWKGTEAVITGRSRPALTGGLARVA